MDPNRLYIGNRFTTMRGAIGFERLDCAVSASSSNSSDLLPLSQRTCSSKTKTPSFATSTTSHTFIRVLLNDVVYPVPGCQNGPGYSCLLDDYVNFVGNKYNNSGNWAQNCGVTAAGAPAVVAGAFFYTDLDSDFLKVISP